MDNNEFDKFIKRAASEELEAPSFLDWGNMNIPVQKKRRGLPFWFFAGMIILSVVAVGWWAVSAGNDVADVVVVEAWHFDHAEAAIDRSDRNHPTFPKHLQHAFFAWLNDDCIEEMHTQESETISAQSTEMATITASPADMTMKENLGVSSSATWTKNEAHLPKGEGKTIGKSEAAEITVEQQLAIINEGETQRAANDPRTRPDMGLAHSDELALRGEQKGFEVMKSMVLKWPSYDLPIFGLAGQSAPLAVTPAKPIRQLFLGAGVNTFRNRLGTNEATGSGFGAGSLGQSFSMAWIQPAKRDFGVFIGITYSRLHDYYEGVQDLGYENDFVAGERVRRQRFVKHNNQFKMLHINVGFHTAFKLGSRLNGFVMASASPGWNLGSSGRLLLANREDVLVLEESGSAHDFVVSTTLSAGLNYWLTEQYALVFRPSYVRYFNGFVISDELESVVKPEVLDLSVGVQVRLLR